MGVLHLQIHSFVLLGGGGIVLGFIFDVFSILKGAFHIKRKLFNDVFDLLFWAISAVIVYALAFIANGGEVRIYIFLGLITGVIIYEKLLRPIFLGFFRMIMYAIADVILKVFGTIGKYIKIPHLFILGFFTSSALYSHSRFLKNTFAFLKKN